MKYCEECNQSYPDGHDLCPVHQTRLLKVSDPEAEEEASWVGRAIKGQYRVEAKLGRGGMGTVYRATQLALGRTCAIKVLHPHMSRDIKVVRRFMREARATSALKHPNIVTIYDFDQTDEGALYIVMEHLEGASLSLILANEGPLAPWRVMAMAIQICHALAEAHNHGVIHRDLKPDNIFITRMKGQADLVKILDFGIAGVANEDILTSGKLTSKNAVIGTPMYISPEQGQGREVDGRTDIYSLGLVMYEALCGHGPYSSDTPMGYIMDHIQSKPANMTLKDGRPLPPGLEGLVLRCLEKDPVHRHPHALALARALEDLLGGRTPPREEDLLAETMELTATPPDQEAQRVQRLLEEGYADYLNNGALMDASRLRLVELYDSSLSLEAGKRHYLEESRAGAQRVGRKRAIMLGLSLAALAAVAGLVISHWGSRGPAKGPGRVVRTGPTPEEMASLLELKVKEHSGTPLGLAYAAQAAALSHKPSLVKTLYLEASAHAYGQATDGLHVGEPCRLIPHPSGPTHGFTVPPSGPARLLSLEDPSQAPQPLDFSPRCGLITPEGIILGDAQGSLNHLDGSGRTTFTLALPAGRPITALAALGDTVAAGDDGGNIFLVREGRRLEAKMSLEGPVEGLYVNEGALVALAGDKVYGVDPVAGQASAIAPLCPKGAPRLSAAGPWEHGSLLIAALCKTDRLSLGLLKGTSYTPTETLPLPQGAMVTALAVGPQVVVLAMADGTIREMAKGPTWRTRALVGHAGPVEDMVLTDTALFTAGADGFIKAWGDLDLHLSARMEAPLPAGEVRGLSDRRWVLVEGKDSITLVGPEEGLPVSLRVEGLSGAALAHGGETVLALLASALEVHQPLVPQHAPVVRPLPMAQASGLWPLDRSGRTMVALASPGGEFMVMDYASGQVLTGPVTWHREEIRKIATDPFLVDLAILYKSGRVALGLSGGAGPSLDLPAEGTMEMATTADGRWLVLLDGAGGLRAIDFGGRASVVQPCRQGQMPQPRQGAPASCLLPLGQAPGQATMAPLERGLLLLAGGTGFSVYDLFAGRELCFIPVGEDYQGPVISTGARHVVYSRPDKPHCLVWPTNAWLFGPPSRWERRLQRVAGYRIQGARAVALGLGEWGE